MYHHIRAVVLGSVKYGDSSRVLRCYTDLFGTQSYLVNSVSNKKGVLKPAMIMPLTHLDLVVSHKGRGTLERIKEARSALFYERLPYQPIRNALALFVAEVLQKCLREEEPDPNKFDFVCHTCHVLDGEAALSGTFPQHFLIDFSRYLGFYPERNELKPDTFFDKIDGIFSTFTPLHNQYLTLEASSALQLLLQPETRATAQLTKATRKMLLQELLSFYAIHIDGFGTLKCVDVLEEVLND